VIVLTGGGRKIKKKERWKDEERFRKNQREEGGEILDWKKEPCRTEMSCEKTVSGKARRKPEEKISFKYPPGKGGAQRVHWNANNGGSM